MPVIVAIDKGEPVPERLSALNVTAVRVEIWRSTLRLDPLSLRGERLLQIEEPVDLRQTERQTERQTRESP